MLVVGGFEINLQTVLPFRPAAPLPAAHQMSVRYPLGAAFQINRGRLRHHHDVVAGKRARRAALHLQPALFQQALHLEAGVELLPVVGARAPAQAARRIDIMQLGMHRDGSVGVGTPAVTHKAMALQLRTGCGGDLAALNVEGRAGDDVDHAIDCVGTPDRRPRPADHLDAGHVLQGQPQRFPHHTGKQRRIDAAPIDQHQQLVGEAVGKAADRHRPLVVADGGNLYARRQTQGFRDVRRTAAPDILGTDDMHGGGRIGERLAFLRRRGHHDAHQFLEIQIQAVDCRCRSRPGGRQQRKQRDSVR